MVLNLKEKFKKDLQADLGKSEENLKKLLQDKSDGIYNVLKNIEEYTKDNKPDPSKPNYDVEKMKKEIWSNISKEWSESLSKQIVQYLQDDLADILTDRIFFVLGGLSDDDEEDD